MGFSDTSSALSGLCQDIDFLVSTTSTTYPLADKARNVNNWYRRTVAWIWENSADWEFDDSNLTTLPTATTDLVNGQQDYGLDTISQKIERVEVMDNSGDYQLMIPIDKEFVTKEAMSELYETDGMPIYYDMVGRSILLYPKPSTTETTLTAGLKIYVSRDVDQFVPGDTTQEPGFANNFHRILSLGASYDYAVSKGLTDKLNYLRGEITNIQKDMEDFYTERHTDFRPRIFPKNQSYI